MFDVLAAGGAVDVGWVQHVVQFNTVTQCCASVESDLHVRMVHSLFALDFSWESLAAAAAAADGGTSLKHPVVVWALQGGPVVKQIVRS